MTVHDSQPGTDRAAIEARLAELYAAQERATGWGAAVGARHEEIKDLEGQLRAMTPKPEPSAPCPTPAWGAKVAQQATAQSEAVAWLIERKDGYVEITRHKEAADGWASVAKITPLGPLATPSASPARDEVLEKRAGVKLELAIEQVLFSRVMKNRVAGYTVETAHEIMELVIAALSSQGVTREAVIEECAQALANDVWHPPLSIKNLPPHEANKFRRQARIVLAALDGSSTGTREG